MNSIPNITIFGKRERVRTSKTYEDTKVRRGRRIYLRVKSLPIMCQALHSVPSTTKIKIKVRRPIKWLNVLEHLLVFLSTHTRSQ